ncbi:MAG: hypothetical protein ACO3JL_05280 [Myxococcota bacterium]
MGLRPLAAALFVFAAPLAAQEPSSWDELENAELASDAEAESGARFASDDESSPAAVEPGPATMKVVSAATSAALMAFTGTGLGVAAAFTNGGLWSLTPRATFRSIEMPMWLGFWTLPALGAAGGSAFGAMPFLEPAGVGVVSGSAVAGTGLGALLGLGVGYGLALGLHGPAPGVWFPNTTRPEWSGTLATGILLGAGLGAAAGAGSAAAVALRVFGASSEEEVAE